MNREFGSLDDFLTEYVTNISSGGVFIRSKRPLPVGTLVNLSFTLLLDEVERIEGVGEVVRLSRDPDNVGMGVVFRQLTPESQKEIARLVAAQGWDSASLIPATRECPGSRRRGPRCGRPGRRTTR